MDLAEAQAIYLPAIEAEMRALLSCTDQPKAGHYGMMQYHMGWVDASFCPVWVPGGKRLRPLLCLLACGAAGGQVERALPAAAGLELLHNFSLIHDDIEDCSPTRRHRPTVWSVFGVPQACNVGDGMFSLAHLAFHRLSDVGVPDTIVLHALRLFDTTCLSLTEGQYLDMSFEHRATVTADEYLDMIAGKTGALLAASPEIGALIAGAGPASLACYAAYGAALGRAFQLQDDILGIWGNERNTGKSTVRDIVSKKKSLPVIYAAAHRDTAERMAALYSGPLSEEAQVAGVVALLEESGARAYVEARIRAALTDAHAALDALEPQPDAALVGLLADLLDSLVSRVA
jgi:geranylgeranyl diphosphate synthase, type I